MIDKKLVNFRFSRAARDYHLHSPVQREMALDVIQCVEKYYQEKLSPGNCLDIGCGTGTLTSHILKLFPDTKVTGLDSAEGMTHGYNAHFSSSSATAIMVDAETWNPSIEYDLIVSNAAFQWFQNPYDALLRYSSFLRPDGLMVISMFGSGTFHELVESFQSVSRHQGTDYSDPRSASLLSLSDLRSLGERSGLYFEAASIQRSVKYPSAGDFFKALRRLGASSADPESIRANLSIVRDAVRDFEKKREKDGGIRVTYECLVYQTWRKQ